MNRFPDYERATNAAYSELLNYHGRYPKIDIAEILSNDKKITVKSYSQAAQYLGISHNEFTYEYASSEYGYTAKDRKKGKCVIYYNNLKSEATIRFTLAHELGHIRLGHEEDSVSDKEANCFARNILCPVPVVDEFGIQTQEDYMDCFGISEPMANVAVDKYKSDYYYISCGNYQQVGDLAYCYLTGQTLADIYGYGY